MTLDDLPGAATVQQGLTDLRASRRTVEALVVGIAEPRMRALGLWEPALPSPGKELELELYRALAERPDPYSSYNAHLRELTSFIRALERRVEGERRGSGGVLVASK